MKSEYCPCGKMVIFDGSMLTAYCPKCKNRINIKSLSQESKLLDNKQLASELAAELRSLATICEQAAEGNKDAQDALVVKIDGYWHGLVVGAGKVESLLS